MDGSSSTARTKRCTRRRGATGICTRGSMAWKRISFSRRARATRFPKRTGAARLGKPPRWPKRCACSAEDDARPLKSESDQYRELVALGLHLRPVEVPERPSRIADLGRNLDQEQIEFEPSAHHDSVVRPVVE